MGFDRYPTIIITGDGGTGDHLDLTSIQGGSSTEQYHLTAAQHTDATQVATTTNVGLLSASDFIAFNDKWDFNTLEIQAIKVNEAANSDTVNNLTVETAVPLEAVFTDTTYTNLSEFVNDEGFITDYTVTEADVVTHESALSVTELQIIDLDKYTTTEVDNLLLGKQDTLVSGVNLKTINGDSLLGVGNIEIVGGTGGISDAPSDGSIYARRDGLWESFVVPTYTNLSEFVNDEGFITDYTVTEADVVTHESALSVTELQIIDLDKYTVAEVDGLLSAKESSLTFGTGLDRTGDVISSTITQYTDGDALTAVQTDTNYVAKGEITHTVTHGSDDTVVRPIGYGHIRWVGSVEPLNAIEGDTWLDTTVSGSVLPVPTLAFDSSTADSVTFNITNIGDLDTTTGDVEYEIDYVDTFDSWAIQSFTTTSNPNTVSFLAPEYPLWYIRARQVLNAGDTGDWSDTLAASLTPLTDLFYVSWSIDNDSYPKFFPLGNDISDTPLTFVMEDYTTPDREILDDVNVDYTKVGDTLYVNTAPTGVTVPNAESLLVEGLSSNADNIPMSMYTIAGSPIEWDDPYSAILGSLSDPLSMIDLQVLNAVSVEAVTKGTYDGTWSYVDLVRDTDYMISGDGTVLSFNPAVALNANVDITIQFTAAQTPDISVPPNYNFTALMLESDGTTSLPVTGFTLTVDSEPYISSAIGAYSANHTTQTIDMSSAPPLGEKLLVFIFDPTASRPIIES